MKVKRGKVSTMIKGILFDKDGTLIDFYDLWLRAALAVVPVFMEKNGIPADDGMEEYLLETFGIKEGKVEPDGALAYKAYGEIAADLSEALAKKGMFLPAGQIESQIVTLFENYVSWKDVKVKPLADLKKLFGTLKCQGIAIGLATADTAASARNCLEALGVLEYFDYVGADDGSCRPKPAPDMLLRFAGKMGIMPEEIMVVGDTYNDIRFAKACGSIAGGVLSGVSRAEDYRGEADYVLESDRKSVV